MTSARPSADQALRDRIRHGLAVDLDCFGVDVIATDGVVTLRGGVRSAAEHLAVRSIAVADGATIALVDEMHLAPLHAGAAVAR